MIYIVKWKKVLTFIFQVIPKTLQVVLNISLVFLAIILSFLLIKELIIFCHLLFHKETNDYKLFLANILIFFFIF